MRVFVGLSALSILLTVFLSALEARGQVEQLAVPHATQPVSPAEEEPRVQQRLRAQNTQVPTIDAAPGSIGNLQGLVLAYDGSMMFVDSGGVVEEFAYGRSAPEVGSTVSCLLRRKTDGALECIRLGLVTVPTRASLAQTESWRADNLADLSSEGKALAQWIRYYNPRLAPDQAQYLAMLIDQKSLQHGLPLDLLASLIAQESAFNSRAVSPVGAAGLGQLMPETARELGVRRVFDIEDNLDGSARYLKQMLVMNRMKPSLALAAYNAGPGAVQNYGGIPPYRETQDYVTHIQRRRAALRNYLAIKAG